MSIGREQLVHGASWAQIHGGYFSDPEVARPLIEAVREVWAAARPDAIVDLGGGTGFLLSQLRRAGLSEGALLMDLDGSEPQLAEAAKAGLACVRGAVDGFRRDEVVPAGRTALWLMRSVLHYAGEAGLDPLLRHLRAQAAAGEFWVHQTACFERAEDAACLNALYRQLRTGKWYPTVAELRQRLAAHGWTVVEERPAPTLILDSDELGLRYGTDAAGLQAIGQALSAEFGEPNDVFRFTPAGFQADLHYRAFICRART